MKERDPKIYSIASEGVHGTGKRTQIELLKDRLTSAGVPYVSVKGEGYRMNKGVKK